MESLDSCPMGIDISRHLGEGPSRHPSSDVALWKAPSSWGAHTTPCYGASAPARWCGGRSSGELSGGNWMASAPVCSLAPRRAAVGVGSRRCSHPREPPPSQRTVLPRLGGVKPRKALRRLCAATIVTWLILPVVICLSQRLSHACLSISNLYGETANGSLNQLSFI